MVAGSILPVAVVNGELMFLFGKENPLEDSARGFSDFGGGVDAGESPYKTAVREAAEELTGFLGDPAEIRRKITRAGGTYNIVVDTYHMHVLLVDYDPMLPIYYNNNHRFLWERMDKKKLSATKLFEKIEIQWFHENEVLRKKKLFRPFFREILDEVWANHLPHIKSYCTKAGPRLNSANKKTVRKLKGGWGGAAAAVAPTTNLFSIEPKKSPPATGAI